MAPELPVVSPGPDSALGMRSFAREAKALLQSLVSAPSFAEGEFSQGQGRSVLLIPGFFAGDWATTDRLGAFLIRLGYRVETAGIFFNFGPTSGLIARIDAALLRVSARGPVDVVGQSFGGILARDLACRFPGRVRKVVTLCSPARIPITTPVAPLVQLLKHFYDEDWLVHHDLIPTPAGVPVIALYSEDDGIVDWRECLQDARDDCENVRVSGAHVTIGSSQSAQAAIARALSS